MGVVLSGIRSFRDCHHPLHCMTSGPLRIYYPFTSFAKGETLLVFAADERSLPFGFRKSNIVDGFKLQLSIFRQICEMWKCSIWSLFRCTYYKIKVKLSWFLPLIVIEIRLCPLFVCVRHLEAFLGPGPLLLENLFSGPGLCFSAQGPETLGDCVGSPPPRQVPSPCPGCDPTELPTVQCLCRQ